MNEPYEAGRKIEAPCEICGGFVSATFDLGALPMDDGSVVNGVMRATCDTCGSIVAVAHQSASVVREALDRRDAGRRATVRLPRTLAAQVAGRLSRKGTPPTQYQLLLAAFANAWRRMDAADREALVLRLGSSDSRSARARKEVTVNIDLGHNLAGFLEDLRRETGLSSRSELVRRVLAAAQEEPEVDRELQNLAMLF